MEFDCLANEVFKMTDIVSAAKTLKALGDDGEALRCVEADPTEVQRMALKRVGKAAGPVVGMFVMGMLEYPRRKQKVLLDAVYAARSCSLPMAETCSFGVAMREQVKWAVWSNRRSTVDRQVAA